MDRRKLSLTLSEDDLRRNSRNSLRNIPTPLNLISEEELRRRIRELMAEERLPYQKPPLPVAAVIPTVIRREPSPVRPLSVAAKPLVPYSPLGPYRRVSNNQYFDWNDDETGPTNHSQIQLLPSHSHDHRTRLWDDPVILSKDNCELCALAKEAFDREQEKKKLKKEGGNLSRHCETLREYQEGYRE